MVLSSFHILWPSLSSPTSPYPPIPSLPCSPPASPTTSLLKSSPPTTTLIHLRSTPNNNPNLHPYPYGYRYVFDHADSLHRQPPTTSSRTTSWVGPRRHRPRHPPPPTFLWRGQEGVRPCPHTSRSFPCSPEVHQWIWSCCQRTNQVGWFSASIFSYSKLKCSF